MNKRKILGVIIGLELSFIFALISIFTLFSYILIGVLSYSVGKVIPIQNEYLSVYFYCVFFLLTLFVSVKIGLQITKKNYNNSKWISSILMVICVTMYYLLIIPVNKEEKVNTELKRLSLIENITPVNYKKYETLLQNKLTEVSQNINLPEYRNKNIFYSEKIDSIVIDTLIISPKKNLAICLISYKSEGLFGASSFFFNPTTNFIYYGGILPHSFGETRNETLLDLHYILYVERKTRNEVIYSPEYKSVEIEVPSILELDYWNKTVSKDTIYLEWYRKGVKNN